MLSVIIRSKNEAAWIARCLFAIANQRLHDIEPILVDNESSDGTREIAEGMGAKVLTISDNEFSYGRAINLGFDKASHPFVAILSAHCLPIDDLWADYLVAALESSKNIAGAYGKQTPLPDTSDFDKRDLWLTFRDERLYQKRDAFFHNANSVVPKTIWHEHPFNEQINGQEDREWGQRMIREGFRINYEPQARVYHFHGIHQGRNEDRAARVVRVIENLANRKIES